MENKINVAELLKDCPKGMELDCTMYDNVQLLAIDDRNIYPIRIQTPAGIVSLTKDGHYSHDPHCKCVIFPKGKTTWEGFVPPCKFKDGDVIYNRLQKKICIYYLCRDGVHCIKGCRYNESNMQLRFEKLEYPIPIAIQDYRLATEEEKQKLFDTIKDNGYKWNPETKTLEKLIERKFKVGDIIKYIYFDRTVAKVVKIHDKSYELDNGKFIEFQHENAYEISYDKFDINTLKPFESRVLVRDNKLQKWSPAMWGFYDFDSQDYQYKIVGGIARYCIPYEGNEHLLGTTNDCDEFYKTW